LEDIISRAWVPIEPVAPKIAIRLSFEPSPLCFMLAVKIEKFLVKSGGIDLLC